MKITPLLLAPLLVFAANAWAANAGKAPSPPVVEPPEVPLSEAVRAHIAAMTPIFDGTTLDGWLEVPRAFGGGDIQDPAGLVKKLEGKSDAVSALVAKHLDDGARKAMTAFTSGENPNPKPLAKALADVLSKAIAGPAIYDPTVFAGVALRPDTEALLRQKPTGIATMRLNRMLLEDAFPHELRESPVVNWIVKDGALASVGAGRGELCTANDYGHYRIVFLVRHVSAEPKHDHQPCVLVFCEHPTLGTLPHDALAGIQFQVPNGGHWDYRPGHNNGGTSFDRPVATKYDNHQWRQVELLVDAGKGTGRMAVAPGPGLRGVENLDFNEKAAGRVGPFALQMHNAGLVDEYKDIRIELDPKEDRLITVE